MLAAHIVVEEFWPTPLWIQILSLLFYLYSTFHTEVTQSAQHNKNKSLKQQQQKRKRTWLENHHTPKVTASTPIYSLSLPLSLSLSHTHTHTHSEHIAPHPHPLWLQSKKTHQYPSWHQRTRWWRRWCLGDSKKTQAIPTAVIPETKQV